LSCFVLYFFIFLLSTFSQHIVNIILLPVAHRILHAERQMPFHTFQQVFIMAEIRRGSLYIVSTPIGNMGDISSRALENLRSVELIACEDTRHTGLFLSRLGIKKKLVSYHDRNERSRVSHILETLAEGSDVAVVCDAGTPGISDPAYRIVHEAVESGFDVYSIPGPSAVLAALVVSGLPLDRFVFEGFLPQKGMKRVKSIEALREEPRTIVIYESPYRIIGLLEQVLSIIGDRAISVSREITKLHEETIRGRVSEVLALIRERRPRGEYTVVINGIGKKGRHEGSSDNI
jgi:16S rRNA (cytidine1402-2'-O)-methyltransferase